MSESTRFSCSKSGDEVLQIGQALRRAVLQGLIARERTANGMRLRIHRSSTARSEIEAYIRREKACCPFLALDLAELPGELSLEITGPPEVSSLVDLLFQLTK